VHRRHRPLLALMLTLAGCFVDAGHASGPTTTASSGPGTATADVDASTAAPLTGAVTDTAAAAVTGDTSDGSTAAASTSDGDPGDPSTAGPATSADPPAFCGDGVVDGGEACDDGNNSDADDCLGDCTLASCADGHKNQDETDVDCGGSCTACGYCQLCLGDPDCAAGYLCDGERCSTGAEVTVDAYNNCGIDPEFWTVGPDLPPGTYRVTAEGGGVLLEDGGGFGWIASCVGVDFGMMYADYLFQTADDAFAALPVTQVNSPYGGGTLRCGVYDDPCDDNLGALSFSLQLLCD